MRKKNTVHFTYPGSRFSKGNAGFVTQVGERYGGLSTTICDKNVVEVVLGHRVSEAEVRHRKAQISHSSHV